VTAKHTLYELMIEGMDPARCIIPARHNLDLIVADTTLLSAQTTMSRGGEWQRWSALLAPISDFYDMILIDSSGSLTPLNANALVAADDIITPTTVEPFSIRGVELLFKQIEQMKGNTDAIRLIVPTMYDPRSSQSLQLLENLQRLYGSRVTQPIRTRRTLV
jgi:chromosome partitioning protein